MVNNNEPKRHATAGAGLVQRIQSYGAEYGHDLDVGFGERLNVTIGPNGSGKTRLLDIAYSALSDRVSQVARVDMACPGLTGRALVDLLVEEERDAIADGALRWRAPVLYARADDTYAIHYAPFSGTGLVLTQPEVMDGSDRRIEGMARDLSFWRTSKLPRSNYSAVSAALQCLGIRTGREVRLPGDPRTFPTFEVSGIPTPLPFISDGLRRLLSIVYLIAWTWNEHRVAALLSGVLPSSRLLVLIDEPEAHVHIDLQRQLLPALLVEMQELGLEQDTQWAFVTHSPVILASAQSLWQDETDRLHDLA